MNSKYIDKTPQGTFNETYLRHWIKKGSLQSRNNGGKVRRQVLGVCETVHVADDLCRHFPRLGATVLERTLHHRHDERQ